MRLFLFMLVCSSDCVKVIIIQKRDIFNLQEMDTGELSGYLADSVETYSDSLHDIFHVKNPEELRKMQVEARQSCKRFSEEGFETSFLKSIEPLFQ